MLWILPILNTLAVISVIGALIYLIICINITSKARKLMPELPYPEGYLPLVGHIFKFASSCTGSTAMWENMTQFCDYYKEGFQGFLGHQVWIFLPDHHVMQEILSSHDAIDKSYVYRSLDSITDGIFIAPNLRWRKLRKRLNLTFSAKQIDSYMDAVNKHTEVFLNAVLRNLQQANKYVDIQPYIARYFFDIMTQTHFDGHTDEQVRDEYKVAETTSEVIELLIEKRLLKPHLHIDFLFKLTSIYEYISQIKIKPYVLIDGLVERRLKASANKESKTSEDRLVYVDLVADTLKEMNIPPTIYNVSMNSSDLLIAGSDTTSIASATLLYHLAVHKDIQEKVYEEVSRVYGQDSFKPLTKQELASMTYLEMTINEALRWSAPPGIIRELQKDFDVGKYVIPKNASVYLMMLPQHSNPMYYERVDEFYPEHFTSEAIKSRPKMAFLPFSSGPRNCPGKQFAYVLLKAAAAVIINNYTVDTDVSSDEIKRKMILMTQHVQGYPIKLTPRHHNTPRG